MYKINIMNDFEYDQLPFKYAKDSLGCADVKTKTAYVRATGVPKWDMITIEHEVMELLSKTSPHEINGIRYKGKTPEVPTPPPAPRYKTAEELFNESVGLMKGQYPLAYGARESALSDIGRGTSFYEQFQPTSIEQALANQYFANVWPDVEREIKGALSLSGMAYSPILAERLGRERGRVGTDIGQYLSNLGQERARYSLERRLGIDPYREMVLPQEQIGGRQDELQKQADYEYQLAKAQADYANAVAKAKKQQQKMMTLTTIGAIGIGALTGGLGAGMIAGGMGATGGALWGGLAGGVGGGLLSPLFGGGGEPPISFGDALSVTQFAKPSSMDKYFDYLTSSAKTGSAQPINLESTRIPSSSWKMPNPYENDIDKILSGYSRGWTGEWNKYPYALS